MDPDLESDDADEIYDDMSFGSFYQMQQISIAEQKYKNLRDIQHTIRGLELPGLPSTVRRSRRLRRLRRGLSPTKGLLAVPQLTRRELLLMTPGVGTDRLFPGSDPRPKWILGQPQQQESPVLARTQPGFCMSPTRQPGLVAPSGYTAKLMMEKSQFRVRETLLTPIMDARPSRTREMARSISLQRLAPLRRSRKRLKAKPAACRGEQKRMLSPLDMLERTSTIYRGGFATGEGRARLRVATTSSPKPTAMRSARK